MSKAFTRKGGLSYERGTPVSLAPSKRYKGTSLIRNLTPLGPYSGPVLRHRPNRRSGSRGHVLCPGERGMSEAVTMEEEAIQGYLAHKKLYSPRTLQ